MIELILSFGCHNDMITYGGAGAGGVPLCGTVPPCGVQEASYGGDVYHNALYWTCTSRGTRPPRLRADLSKGTYLLNSYLYLNEPRFLET